MITASDISGIGGYYYDSDLGFYYLQSRYYDPGVKRFINADGYVSTGQGLLGYNMFAYCGNNPVMYTDPSGHIPEWIKTAIDIGLYIITGVASVAVGVVAGTVAGIYDGIKNGVESGLKTGGEVAADVGIRFFGGVNNLTNAVYYTFISDKKSDLTSTSYHNGYINRWDRLDYTKKETEQSIYNDTARLYFSEYNLHMYGWFVSGWAYDKNIPVFSEIAKKAKEAYITSGKDDKRPWVSIPSRILGVLGL